VKNLAIIFPACFWFLTSFAIAEEAKERSTLLFFNQPANISMDQNDMFEKIIRDRNVIAVITIPLSKNEQVPIPYSLIMKTPDGRILKTKSLIEIKGGITKTVRQ
jgi:hypothetical protein